MLFRSAFVDLISVDAAFTTVTYVQRCLYGHTFYVVLGTDEADCLFELLNIYTKGNYELSNLEH